MNDCIFCKIVKGEIPSKKVYEDEDAFAFHDINPAAPVHLLLIPKLHIDSLAAADASHTELLGKLLLLAPKLAQQHGLGSGFRTAIHTGHDGGQIVFHLHLHIIGGGKTVSTL
ncbi:MAG: HIT domain-containing protein [Gallionellaceae bacterium]|jgi:histidine triad (HIT) family protein